MTNSLSPFTLFIKHLKNFSAIFYIFSVCRDFCERKSSTSRQEKSHALITWLKQNFIQNRVEMKKLFLCQQCAEKLVTSPHNIIHAALNTKGKLFPIQFKETVYANNA